MINSNRFNNLRASPPEILNNNSVSFKLIFFVFKKGSSAIASSNKLIRSDFPWDSNVYTWHRDNNAGMTSNEGFSVVAPIRVMIPFSTAFKRESCWDLEKRCISSINKIVPFWWNKPLFSTLWITSLTSLTPEDMAEIVCRCLSAFCAIK